MMHRVAGCLAVAAAATIPQAASARDFQTTIPTLPLHYLYAACVFGNTEPTAAAQIESCRERRADLEEAAEQVLADFHDTGIRQERRVFLRSLDRLEQEAAELRSDGKAVPPVVLAYVECLGSAVAANESYRSGTAIDFIPVYRPCASSTGIERAASADRDVNSMYHRFEIRRRFVDTKAPGSRWPETEFRYGFFDPRRVPETGVTQEG